MSMFGLYMATPPTLTDGRITQILTDSHGNLSVVGAIQSITLAASAARTTSANGTAVSGLAPYRRTIAVCTITASATDAGDTLDVYVDVSMDGTTWINAVHFTQQAGNGSAKTMYAVLDPANPGTSVIDVTSDAASGAVRPALWGPYMRARWALVDGSANANTSHTFSVTAYTQG